MGFPKGAAHPNAVDWEQRLQEIKEMDLGDRFVPDGEVISKGQRSRRHLRLECRLCGETKDYLVENITSGKSRRCTCDKRTKYRDIPRHITKSLGDRFDAAKQRCDPKARAMQRRYALEGISVEVSREEFIRYFYERYSEWQIINYDIDRINNDGDYELGNLRMVPRADNLNNRELTRFTYFRGERYPASALFDVIVSAHPNFSYSRDHTGKLARSGLTGAEIILRDKLRRIRKRRRPRA
ncbi:hypothetical protein [Phaeobacter italicus]|jgi:hypothetical protein|uniref:hypothetical protein n=1 Tax=Phaeobacter italicus TaxID=481446 RepID=UPI002FDEC078